MCACASSGPPAPAAAGPAAEVILAAPDDSDLWNLVGAGAESIADVDMAALSRSPWSSALVTGGLAEDRAERLRSFGYDVFTQVDRLLVAAAGAAESLTVARGRFEPDRLAAAFSASTAGARAGRWRESPLWEGQGRALALVTPRTLAQGTPAAVRGAIDAAWGVMPDARAGTLGEMRRALAADQGAGPAITIAVVVTDEVRSRAAGFMEIPPALRRCAARVDLGRDLDVEARAFFDGAAPAARAAEIWGAALHDLAGQRMVRLLGVAPFIEGVTLRGAGPEVRGHLHVGEERREALSERLLFLLATIARQRPAQPPAPP